MQQNFMSPYPYQNGYCPQTASPNAVSINIIAPQAYASAPNTQMQPNYYPIYGTNQYPMMPMYPMNYNNMIQQSKMPDNSRGLANDTQLYDKTRNTEETSTSKETNEDDEKTNKKDKKKKKITPLTDQYVMSLENYLNNDNPKIRLIAAKELLERFKETEERKDSPYLIPLLNKVLRDPSPSVRFLGLTALQVGYSVGNDETVSILKEIQEANKDKIGEDALLASEILLKLSAPQSVEVKNESKN